MKITKQEMAKKLAAHLIVVQKIQAKRGQTFYCNCESEACAAANAHPVCVCQKNAKTIVQMPQGTGVIQLCPDCLAFARKTVRLVVPSAAVDQQSNAGGK